MPWSRENPSPESQTLAYLVARSDRRQGDLEKACGLRKGMLSVYCTGFRQPAPEILFRVGQLVGFTRAEVELARLRFSLPGAVRFGPPRKGETPPWGVTEDEMRRVRVAASDRGLITAHAYEAAVIADLSRQRLKEARDEAERRFQELLSTRDPRKDVRTYPEYQGWLVVEKLCDASERSAGKDAKRALYLAELALLAAESFQGPEEERSRARGYALIFVGNTQRVWSDLEAADRSFAQAERLWKEGEGAHWVLLEEWRLADRLASLRRDQRRWKEVFALLNEALRVAPRGAWGRILLNKAAALNQMGEYRRSLRVLRKAQPLIEEKGDPRQIFALRFNIAANLIQIRGLTLAERLLPDVRRMAIELRLGLDLVRVDWLEGRIAGARGRLEEGIEILQAVRREFTAREIAYDAALAGLDESIFLLQAGDFTRARQVAAGTAWVFRSKKVRAEALKALRLFHEALRGEAATVELAWQVRERFLRER